MYSELADRCGVPQLAKKLNQVRVFSGGVGKVCIVIWKILSCHYVGDDILIGSFEMCIQQNGA